MELGSKKWEGLKVQKKNEKKSHTRTIVAESSSSPAEAEEEGTCYLPSVLRDRPASGRGGRGAPPPVPPRSPRGKGGDRGGLFVARSHTAKKDKNDSPMIIDL